MTKEELYEIAFQNGRDGHLSPGTMPQEYHAYSTEEWDAWDTWIEGWHSGHEYALDAGWQNSFQHEKWLDREDYDEWAEMHNS